MALSDRRLSTRIICFIGAAWPLLASPAAGQEYDGLGFLSGPMVASAEVFDAPERIPERRSAAPRAVAEVEAVSSRPEGDAASATSTVRFNPHVGPDAGAERSPELARQFTAVVVTVERFARVKPVAWPTVRDYVWDRCFADTDVFAAYGHSQPGNEKDAVVNFSLMIDTDVWATVEGDERKRLLSEARRRFHRTMKDLGLDGSLQIMLTSGTRRS